MKLLTYLVKKISTLILTLWMISISLFFLQKNVAGDVVLLQNKARSGGSFYIHPLAAEKVYRGEAVRLNLDKPLFYFSLKARLIPDTFYRIQYPEAQKIQKSLLLQTGNWPLVQDYFQALTNFYEKVARSSQPVSDQFWKIRLQEMALSDNVADLRSKMKVPQKMRGSFESEYGRINKMLSGLSKNTPSFFDWFPVIHWYGSDNQYHQWFVKVTSGDFGISSRDGRLVKEKIKEALPWTLWVNGLAIGLAYLISFPLGIFMALLPGSLWTKGVNNILLVLYALPAFWIGSLLLSQATLPDAPFSFFSISGWSYLQQNGGFIAQPLPFLLQLSLPVFCMTYGITAYLTNYMQSSFLKVLKEPYILYAGTKGISGFRLHFRHVLPNALLPQIVFFAGVIPALVTGSVVVEVIFNIPGMGRLFLDSMLSQDWTTVYTFVLLIALLTALGLIVSDVLLVLSDPRIRISSANREAL
jgi:peptide/nickel transport system permease protein